MKNILRYVLLFKCKSSVGCEFCFFYIHSAFTCFAFQSYPSDAELINKHIPHFLGIHMLFGGGVYPGSRKRRRPTRGPVPKNHPAGGAGSSRVRAPSGHPPDATNASDDNDDDFMPPDPSGLLPNDDEDNFMPRPPPRPPCSPPNPEDQPTWGPTLPRPLPPLRLPPVYPPPGDSSLYSFRHTKWP
jgi:hypothetical protein